MKISVCMATYNGEDYLKEQLDSILLQLESEDELIISDDHSTDQTPEILQIYAERDARIQLYTNSSSSKGVLTNFTTAFAHASGDLVFLADQDDIWLPDKRSVIIRSFIEKPDLQVVMSDLTMIDGKGEKLAPSYLLLRRCRIGFWRNIWRNSYVGCAMTVRREFLQQVALPFPAKIPMHDMWIGLLADYRHQSIIIPTPLVYYRRHAATATQLKSQSSFRQKLNWRIILMYFLFKRLWFNK